MSGAVEVIRTLHNMPYASHRLLEKDTDAFTLARLSFKTGSATTQPNVTAARFTSRPAALVKLSSKLMLFFS